MMGWWGFGWSSMIVMLIFWVAVIALAVWLVSVLFPQSPGAPRSQVGPPGSDLFESALDGLKRQYARGEMSRAGYEKERASLIARLQGPAPARPDGTAVDPIVRQNGNNMQESEQRRE